MVEVINKITCKNCGSEGVVKYGLYKGVQRYYCKVCQRKFKADDSLFHMKVSANHISTALSMYYSGSSISDIRNHLKQEHGYYPSKHVVFEWVDKFTSQASKQFRDVQPKVGDTWIADETVLSMDKGIKVWFFDIIDTDTRFLLATHMSYTRTTKDAQALMKQAYQRTGKIPRVIYTDKLRAYLDGIELTFGADTIHKLGNPFDVENNTNFIERFHGTLKERTKVMRGLHSMESARLFLDGWLVHYNFFRPHMSLNDSTPASVAGIKFPFRNWKDITEQPYEKTARIPVISKAKTIPIMPKSPPLTKTKSKLFPLPR